MPRVPRLGQAKVAFRRIADLSTRVATPEAHLHLARASNGVMLTPGNICALNDVLTLWALTGAALITPVLEEAQLEEGRPQ